jgi:hypothetical protein
MKTDLLRTSHKQDHVHTAEISPLGCVLSQLIPADILVLISLIWILNLYSPLGLGISNDLFLWDLPTKSQEVYIYLIVPLHVTCLVHIIPLYLITISECSLLTYIEMNPKISLVFFACYDNMHLGRVLRPFSFFQKLITLRFITCNLPAIKNKDTGKLFSIFRFKKSRN